jgi:putative ABC transport system permease protein
LEGSGAIKSIYIFSTIALFVLLIACINYMNLTTARSMRRSREVAIRKVGGAGRLQLMQQFFSESVILSFMALILAVGLVWLLLPLFNDLAEKTLTLRNLSVNMVLILVGVTLLTGIIAGSYPALHLSSIKPVSIMNRQSRPASGIFRKLLVIFQFALSIFLIICTIFFSKQLTFLGNRKLGFQTDHIVFIPMNERLKGKFSAFRQELLSNPGISGVSATSNKIGTSPFWGTTLSEWEGKTRKDPIIMNIIYADCDFQQTFDLPMAAGRYYTPGSPVDSAGIVINEMAARQMGMAEPIGKKMFNDSTPIIGVLKDFNFRSLHKGIEPLVIIIDPQWYTGIAIRINAVGIPSTLGFIERTTKKFAPEFPYEYSFLEDEISKMYASEQRMRRLFNYFSILAIFITCLGLFGLASFSAEQRTREIGIRKVMGANSWQISYRFAREFAGLVILANLIAWPAAWFVMDRWLQGFAYRTGLNLWVFITAGLAALLLAAITMSSQTISAANINPAQTMKDE